MMFNPNLIEIIKMYKMDPQIFIAKNSGLKDILGDSKKEAEDAGIKIFELRGEDIPNIVEDSYLKKGSKAIGITGDDLFDYAWSSYDIFKEFVKK